MAEKEDRFILTQDTDFGQIYYFSDQSLKIIVVKASKQSPNHIQKILTSQLPGIDDVPGLYIVREDSIRKLR